MTATQYAVARFYSQSKAALLAPTIERYRAEESPVDRPSLELAADPEAASGSPEMANGAGSADTAGNGAGVLRRPSPRPSLSPCYRPPLLHPSEIAASLWERQRVDQAERLLK